MIAGSRNRFPGPPPDLGILVRKKLSQTTRRHRFLVRCKYQANCGSEGHFGSLILLGKLLDNRIDLAMAECLGDSIQIAILKVIQDHLELTDFGQAPGSGKSDKPVLFGQQRLSQWHAFRPANEQTLQVSIDAIIQF